MSQRTCSIPDCDRTLRSRELCAMHHTRLRRHGDPLKVRPSAQPYMTPQGYLKIKREYVHRKVLLEKIGEGTHPCNWCGRHVTWGLPRGADAALYVDHVDEDKVNNAPANLVPSCNPCNSGRSNRRR